jgi:hypothetical protein
MTAIAQLSPFTRRQTLPIPELIGELQAQQNRKLDLVIPAHHMRATTDGHLEIDGVGEPLLTADGVTLPSGRFTPTRTFDAGIADKLGVPQPYQRKMRDHGLHELLAHNVNTWLQREPGRKFLIRTFRGEHGAPGVARALLSDSYRVMDNYELLLAVLDGIQELAAEVRIHGELTERRMHVKIVAKNISTEAPQLLRNYRSPFSGQNGADCPIVDAGVLLSNSEVGAGAARITPQLTVRVCSNGMTMVDDSIGSVHTGSQLVDGIVDYSHDTRRKDRDLVAAKTRDAVHKFLNVDYMVAKINEIIAQAQVPVADPQATIKHVGKTLSYTATEQAGILAHFIRGGDVTAGGVLHAVTSAAQTLPDPDAGFDLERTALQALAVAARFQR